MPVTNYPFSSAFVVLAVVAGTLLSSISPAVAAPDKSRPVLIAHRGASGLRPEHTLAAYELAIEQGADFVEPDLVATRDGVLVARHENDITGTTDIAAHPEFADRKTTKKIDGKDITGWFTEDFTLAELKTLRCKERIPDLRPENARYNGKFEIPTLQEVIDLVKRRSRETGRTIGIYPETKHPTHFRTVGLPLEDRLVEVLNKNGYTGPGAPVFIQSFEVANLKELHKKTKVRLVQLLGASGSPYDVTAAGGKTTYADMVTPAGLKEIARYAAGIGPEKALLIPRRQYGELGEPTTVVKDAHAAGLVVHPWTFRRENFFLPRDFRTDVTPGSSNSTSTATAGDLAGEIRRFLALGIDGLFSDFPGDAAAVLQEAAK